MKIVSVYFFLQKKMSIPFLVDNIDDENLLNIYNSCSNDDKIKLFDVISDERKEKILNHIPEEKYSCPICQLDIFWRICIKDSFEKYVLIR